MSTFRKHRLQPLRRKGGGHLGALWAPQPTPCQMLSWASLCMLDGFCQTEVRPVAVLSQGDGGQALPYCLLGELCALCLVPVV